jgi:gliding motility-associated-like protein
MRRLIYLLALWAPITSAQCDVAISSWDATTGDIVIEAINSENCGCNEFTSEGNTCETSGSPYVANNTTINHIVLGLHVEGLDYNWGCTGAVNHPGWTFKAFTLFGNQVLESGDTWSANVYDTSLASACWAEILANDSLCTELVVWQINLSRTASTSEGGWAVNGGGALQTQNYPDVDLANNTAVYCAPIACDTVYVDVIEYIDVIEYLTDTIEIYVYADTVEIIEYVYDTITLVETIYENVYITDTLWLTEYINTTDTLWLTEYITDTIIEYVDVEWITYDTIYVDVIVDNYVYVTDTLTLTEYILSIEYIDCDTGEACDEGPGMDGCDDDSIFIPNTFTPNNDGVNDVFYVVTDVTCWLTWNLQIYNRWGTLVEEMTDPTDYWTGTSRSGHWLCPDGVYTWKLNATEEGSATQLNGMVTIFR